MDEEEAQALAQEELSRVEAAGYAVASEHIDTVVLKEVHGASGTGYEIEVSYQWRGGEHEEILVICRVTSKEWFSHRHVEESLHLRVPES
ncbi:MAG: hypothetical protein R3228_06700 [Halioglobus sp.]|nr:hypothetical protein [Halioglobus sp.]